MSKNNIKIFRARWLLPISESPIEDGDIVINTDENQIVDVGTHTEIRKKYSQTLVKDFGNSIIFPGFINAHVHLEEPLLENRPQDYLTFLKTKPDIRNTPEKKIKKQAVNNIKEAHEYGTVAFANLSKTGISGQEAIGDNFFCRVFMELSGFRNINALDIFRKYSKIIDSHEMTKNLTYHYAFSNLWSTSPKLLRMISANELHTMLHFGLLEEERNFFLNGKGLLKQFLLSHDDFNYSWKVPGMQPIKYYLQNSFNTKHNIFAHACDINQEDVKLMQKYDTKINICVCPRSDQNFELKKVPVQMLQNNGVNVCLGTEGKFMVDDLNIRKEIRLLIEEYGISAENAIKIATLNGAYAIGFHRELGSLSPHKTSQCYIMEYDNTYNDPYEVVALSDKPIELLLNK
ncbi:MAG: amidohydrolase family protein [Candidatus Marinimicrobia bacterium]|nr:amidohydrolase family protein [Candidatus Neomarinimicrobiota bacterium]